MITYIKKLKEKDEDKRKRIFFWTMTCSMSIVVLIWFYSLGMRFGNPEVKEQTNEDIKPFKLFKDSISNTFSNIGSSVKNAPSVNKIKEEAKDDSEINSTSDSSQINLVPVENNNQ